MTTGGGGGERMTLLLIINYNNIASTQLYNILYSLNKCPEMLFYSGASTVTKHAFRGRGELSHMHTHTHTHSSSLTWLSKGVTGSSLRSSTNKMGGMSQLKVKSSLSRLMVR